MQAVAEAFAFAIVADAHIRLDTDRPSGEYPSNSLFNGRNQAAIQQINQLSPDLVIHLGDLVHTIPSMPNYRPAMQLAQKIYQQLNAPLHVVPGNHDIGDKPQSWVPAPAVSQKAMEEYGRFWGATYTSFNHKGCHFLLLNSPLLNSGLPAEAEQRAWLEADLEENARTGRPVFLFTHYPLYLARPDEAPHYDNIDQPAREWLLSLLDQYQVRAVFSGHVHNFFYDRLQQTELYVLPSLSFIRPGFSELFDVEPAAEYGRDDAQKLGFCLVTVDDTGHQVQLIRTQGRTEVGETPPSPYPPPARQGAASANTPGIFLRQAWASPVTLSYEGLDEFSRKQARNDYWLWAAWDMGIQRLRLPLEDLAGSDTRERMAALQAGGHAFTVFSTGVPDGRTRELIRRYHHLLEAWEVIAPWSMMPEVTGQIAAVQRHVPVKVYLSHLRQPASSPDQEGATAGFDHFPSYGFRVEEVDLVAVALNSYGAAGLVNGLVFDNPVHEAPWEGIVAARQLVAGSGVTAVVHIPLPRASEGVPFTSSLEIANRVAETVAAASSQEAILFLDTLADQERGYFPRHGLVDRRYNPRPAYHVFHHLSSWLSVFPTPLQMERVSSTKQVRAFRLSGRSKEWLLLLSLAPVEGQWMELERPAGIEAGQGQGTWLDLHTGKRQLIEWRAAKTAGFIQLRPAIDTPRFCPALVALDRE